MKLFHEIGGKRVYRLEFRLSLFSPTLILHFNPSVNQVGHGCYGKFGLCKTLVHWIFHGELWIRLFLSEILWSVSEKSSEKRKEIILARSKRVKFNGYFQVVEADKRIFEKKEVLQQVTYRIPFRFGSFFQEFGIFAFILKQISWLAPFRIWYIRVNTEINELMNSVKNLVISLYPWD